MSTQTDTDEFTISDEVYEKATAYNDDGTVDVEISDFAVHRSSDHHSQSVDKVTVLFKTPARKTKEETMRWPKYPSEEYKLIRILNQLGLEFTAVEQLRSGEEETVKADPDDWTIVAEKTRRQKTRDLLTTNSGIVTTMRFLTYSGAIGSIVSGSLFIFGLGSLFGALFLICLLVTIISMVVGENYE